MHGACILCICAIRYRIGVTLCGLRRSLHGNYFLFIWTKVMDISASVLLNPDFGKIQYPIR
jgi:hypothetical protein